MTLTTDIAYLMLYECKLTGGYACLVSGDDDDDDDYGMSVLSLFFGVNYLQDRQHGGNYTAAAAAAAADDDDDDDNDDEWVRCWWTYYNKPTSCLLVCL